MTAEEILDKRQNKLEEVIEKLTNISNDLNKILAVHEQRINHQEKTLVEMSLILEKRREDHDTHIKNIYETIRQEDKSVLAEISKMENKTLEQYGKMGDKIGKLEKLMWTYIGGFTAIVGLINYLPALIKVFQ